MKVGDMVSLSSKGKGLQMNMKVYDECIYGLLVNLQTDLNCGDFICTVRWFQKNGIGQKVRHHHYRYELKKFKKL